MAWFEKQEVDVLEWPSLSTDVNPIENMWGSSLASFIAMAVSLRQLNN
jgi:hypothetical protein